MSDKISQLFRLSSLFILESNVGKKVMLNLFQHPGFFIFLYRTIEQKTLDSETILNQVQDRVRNDICGPSFRLKYFT